MGLLYVVVCFFKLILPVLAVSVNNLDSPKYNASSFVPTGLYIGSELNAVTETVQGFTLNSTSPIATVDFGVERAGIPYFKPSGLSGDVQIEVRYSEQFNSLSHNFSDGPFPYANGLSNTFRVETFNVTSTGTVASRLIQGGQRWMSLELITPGSIDISEVGFIATIDTTEVDDLPGGFTSSDAQLNEIWKLGARASSAACVEEGTQGPIWDIDATNGALVHSTRALQGLSANSYSNYTLEFDATIVRGGLWWTVAFPMIHSAGVQIMLTGELPQGSTFANVNQSSTPANTIQIAYGYAVFETATVPSTAYGTFDIPFSLHENTWYRIKTVLTDYGNISVAIDGTQVFEIAMPGVSFLGPYGFGNWQDQSAYVRNVNVTDTASGTVLYTNPMTSDDVLADFGAQANLGSVCLDGAKRDRLVWIGDFYHTARIIGVSTSRYDLSRGTLDFILKTQTTDATFNTHPVMSYDPTKQSSFPFPDYDILGMLAFYHYVRQTNDLAWASSIWAQWQLLVEKLIAGIDPYTGLVTLPYAFIGPYVNGSAVSCLTVEGFKAIADVALALGDTASVERYQAAAANLTDAINTHLWNDNLGAYMLDIQDPESISTVGTGLCITSGVTSANQTARSLAAVEELFVSLGYKDNSNITSTNKLSPFLNGFLLPAFFKGNASLTGIKLIRGLWGAMANDPNTASGASWEYVNPDGSPGLGDFTSLSHPWGGAATYVLTEWVAGLQAAEGIEGFGHRNWVLSPDAGIQIGLKEASARVSTPFGSISTEWQVECNKTISVMIDAPSNTVGTFRFQGTSQVLAGQTKYALSIPL
ncbi:Six-hairpin glycosidase-like protein [Nemania sp. FL0031]|nr:Six-hairpin glycosidase-like protein [Nemania sp. FL0031]